MGVVAEQESVDQTRHVNRPALLVVAGSALCLVGAGLLLWSQHGPAVFSDMLVAALAWCF